MKAKIPNEKIIPLLIELFSNSITDSVILSVFVYYIIIYVLYFQHSLLCPDLKFAMK